MKTVAFSIKSLDESLRDFAEVFEAVRRGETVRPRSGVYFTSVEAMRNFLTPKRVALLKLIKKRNPRSIYALAKLAKRSFPSVLKDVELLKKHGLIELTRQKNSPRRSVRARVGYDSIHVCIGI